MSEANTAAREINKDKQVLGEKHVKDDEKVRQWENLENFSFWFWSLVCYLICARSNYKAYPRNTIVLKIIKLPSIISGWQDSAIDFILRLIGRDAATFLFQNIIFLLGHSLYNGYVSSRASSYWYAAASFLKLDMILRASVGQILFSIELVLFPIQKFYLIFKTFQIVDHMICK